MTRKSTLHSSTELALKQGGQVITEFKKGSRVASCKGSYKTGKLKTVKSRENRSLWASRTAVMGAVGWVQDADSELHGV